MRKILLLLLFIFLLLVIPISVSASEVPFEVSKVYVISEYDDTSVKDAECVAVDGVLYSSSAEGELVKYTPKKGEFDKRVHIPLEKIKYKLEYWNVGDMGGEKGFIFKSSYGKAKLTISYETGQATRLVETGQSFGKLKLTEERRVSTPSFKDTYEYELEFTGGPYGIFYYYDKKENAKYVVARIHDGRDIVFEHMPESHYLFYEENVHMKVGNRDAFEKWMDLVETPGCQDPTDPTTDSGIRFSDYEGEVYIRACNEDDEETEAYAELGMVLHRNDIVRTGDDSYAILGLPDMSEFRLGPNSKVILSYVPEKRSLLKMIKGRVWANIKHVAKYGTLEVEMSQAVAGIKGTTFVLEDDGEISILKVIEGSVELTSKNDDKKELVKTGEMVHATSDGLKGKSSFNNNEESKYWNSIKTTSKGNPSKEKYELSFMTKLIVIIMMVAGYYFYKRSLKK